RKGAFTGSVESRPGHVRAADGGTLFLDEIAELPMESQAALLRVLAESQVMPLGTSEAVEGGVPGLAGTPPGPHERVTAGKFRAALLARLSGFTIRLPPLRWRREDLGLLIASLLRKLGAQRASFTCEAGRALLRHRWPMNIRELEKALEAALVLAG